jgi:hypothetical protein
VRDATRFKRDALQVSAPARQAEVFAACARWPRRADGFRSCPTWSRAAYRTLVAGFVAAEQRLFDQPNRSSPNDDTPRPPVGRCRPPCDDHCAPPRARRHRRAARRLRRRLPADRARAQPRRARRVAPPAAPRRPPGRSGR